MTWPPVSVVMLGDSIGIGYGSENSENPWIKVALDAASIPHMNLAKNAEQLTTFLAMATYAPRARLMAGAKYAVVMYGTNDLGAGRSAAQVLADLTTLGNRLVARGLTPYICTLPPRTTSTDSWVTTGNQTVVATEAARVTINTAVRAGHAPYGTNVIETADSLETARNSGIWKATGAPNAYTSDGAHPIGTGTTALAAAVPVAQFV